MQINEHNKPFWHIRVINYYIQPSPIYTSIKEWKTPIAHLYTIYILCVVIWGIGSALIGCVTNLSALYIIWGAAYTGVLFIPVFFYHAVCLISKDKNPWKISFFYAQAAILIIIIASQVMTSHEEIFFAFYGMKFHKATLPFSISFAFWLLVVISSHMKLFYYYRKTYPQKKTKFAISFGLFWVLQVVLQISYQRMAITGIHTAIFSSLYMGC